MTYRTVIVTPSSRNLGSYGVDYVNLAAQQKFWNSEFAPLRGPPGPLVRCFIIPVYCCAMRSVWHTIS